MTGPPDLVVIGAAGPDASAAYAAVAAQRMGRAAGLLTTLPSDPPLPDGIQTITIDPGASARLSAEHVPWTWLDTEILLAAPMAGELDPAMLGRFSRSLVGVIARGFLRGLNPAADPDALSILPPAGVLFLAESELPEAPDGQRLPIGATPIALSAGPLHGIRLSWQGRWRTVSEDSETRHDWTSAAIGVLAAAFLVRLTETRDPALAARFAAAALTLLPTTTPLPLTEIPTRKEVEAALNPEA